MGTTGGFLGYFGDELRHHREHARLTQAEVGDRAGYGNGLVSKIERGERVPQPPLCASLDDLFGTGGFFARLGARVRDDTSPPARFREYLEREPQASAIHTYEPLLIPGLLQTEAYARAVMQAGRPAPTAAEVDARVALRLTRQDVLTREPPLWLWAVMGEAALHVQIGGRATMRDQLRQVLTLAGLPHVTVQVLPYAAGIGPAIGLAFVIAEFEDGTYAYHADALDQFSLGAVPGGVDDRRKTFDHLRALALPEDQSARLITSRVEELGT